jgi:hypothetical protein
LLASGESKRTVVVKDQPQLAVVGGVPKGLQVPCAISKFNT